jgi:hypothetical protein
MIPTLLPGAVHARPEKKRSQAYSGIQPLSPLTAQTQHFQPLPRPIGLPPYHYNLETVLPGIGELATTNRKIIFHTVGDTGGIKNPEYQRTVAAAMKEDLDLPASERPSFFYHLGDVVYYNGEPAKYYDEFYEPYDHYDAPIFSIPGNHDGDPLKHTSQKSLDGWIKYFMTKVPHVDPLSADAPRVTMSQPNVYFTLACPFVTIVGLYTNVPEGGSVESVQQRWLTHELYTAPKDKALIVCMHHPIYSFDDHHSGSPAMADVLQHAINDSRRVPNMVLTAHVHNYQRIERTIVEGKPTPFIVAGNGGYYHLHNLTADAGTVDDATGAHLLFGDDNYHGYLTLAVDAKHISGKYVSLDKSGKKAKHEDFSYTSEAKFLPKDVVLSL